MGKTMNAQGMQPMKLSKIMTSAVIGLSLAGMAGCASGPAARVEPPAQAGQSVPGTAVAADEYKLGSGDQVKITVFNEPSLSGTFAVDGQGVISMSLIGEVPAKDLTIRELQRQIETKLRGGYLRDPQVSAEVTNFRPYYILGEVNRPGEYPYQSGLTVMNAIASAGDFTYRADRKRIVVKSKDNAEEEVVELTPGTAVQPGDTIRVRERFF
jgi:protein involved in polysaccharide export with SLBB domain